MNRKQIPRLHFITHQADGYSVFEQAENACKGGADCVQLRMKNESADNVFAAGIKIGELCKRYNIKFIINDHVDIAQKLNADGIHLGKNDMNPREARQVLGSEIIIGGTANDINDIRQLTLAGVDYIGLGPYRFTPTKGNLSPILGVEGYREIIDKCKINNYEIPLIAIGGINYDDIKSLMSTGVYGIAASSSIIMDTDPIMRTSIFMREILLNSKIN